MIDYHGRRQPCHADLATLIEGVRLHRPDVWEVITDDGRLVPQPLRHEPQADRRRLRFRPLQVAGDSQELLIA